MHFKAPPSSKKTPSTEDNKAVALFISDLHLEHEKSPKFKLLTDCILSNQTKVDSFYILGDLFEAWIGDEQMQLFPKLIQLLTDLAKTVPTFFIAGNRDFLIGRDFFQTTGITPLPDTHLLSIGNQRYHLSHGDLFCTQDEAYQQFRKMVHHPDWQAQFLATSFEQRLKQAAAMRLLSQKTNSEKSEAIMDVTESVITQTLEQHQCHIIHGHTHRRAIHPYPNQRQRIVLGDWSDESGNAYVLCQNPTYNHWLNF